MTITRYEVRGGVGDLEIANGPYKANRQVVLLCDHRSSHEYYEVIELKKFFEVFGPEPAGVVWNQHDGIFITHFLADKINFDYCNKWMGWKACAKSRAEQ